MTRLTPKLEQLIKAHPAIAPTGRIKSFLYHPERKTLAPSCMLRVYEGDLKKELPALSWYLQTNAGIKIHLANNCLDNWKPSVFKWWFDIGIKHPDRAKMGENKGRLWNGQSVDVLINVEDDMNSIRQSWIDFIDAAQKGASILVDLSDIRPAGRRSETAVISTGVFGLEEDDEGFLSVYVWLADYLANPCIENLLRLFGGICKVIARGGTHKNGIITTSANATAPFIWNYLDFPLSDVPGGSKKGVRFDKSVLKDEQLCERIVQAVNEESVFLEKIRYQNDRQLYLNVCQAISLEHSASCLITPVNVAQCANPEDIVEAFCATTRFLCELHTMWREMAHNYNPELYLSVEQDRQVAVTVLGLASFLAAQGVTYEEHVEALEYVRVCGFNKKARTYFSTHEEWLNRATVLIERYPQMPDNALRIAFSLWNAYQSAAEIARSYGLERVFSVEPTQRCYLDYTDLAGYTVSRQIDPPFSNPEGRESAVHGEDIVQYHPYIEIASDVGQDLHQQHHEEWQLMMESTGLAHSTSFDLYFYVDVEWFKDFVERSPLGGTYYQQYSRVNQSYLDKGQLCVIDDPDCVVCGS
jgi:hypothetical protein